MSEIEGKIARGRGRSVRKVPLIERRAFSEQERVRSKASGKTHKKKTFHEREEKIGNKTKSGKTIDTRRTKTVRKKSETRKQQRRGGSQVPLKKDRTSWEVADLSTMKKQGTLFSGRFPERERLSEEKKGS